MIQVNVESDIQPVSAIGFFVTAESPIQMPVSEILQLDDNRLVISIPYDETQVPKDAMATAMVTGEDGRVVFANMRPVFAPEPKESFFKIPLCAPEKISQLNMEEQLNLLESLIEVRGQRRLVAQKAVLDILNGDLLVSLQKLENSFGLENTPPLGPGLPPVILVDRLNRILEAAKSYEAAEKRANSSEAGEN